MRAHRSTITAETAAAARRLLDLEAEADTEIAFLLGHYRAGRAGDVVFNHVSLLVSAGLYAEREARDVVGSRDENELSRADIVAEEIARVIRKSNGWRRSIDAVHRIRR